MTTITTGKLDNCPQCVCRSPHINVLRSAYSIRERCRLIQVRRAVAFWSCAKEVLPRAPARVPRHEADAKINRASIQRLMSFDAFALFGTRLAG